MGMLYTQSKHIAFGFINENKTAIKYSKLLKCHPLNANEEWIITKNATKETKRTNQQTPKKIHTFIDPTMISQLFCDVTKRPSFVHSADSRSDRQHWYWAWRLNSRYVVGSGWYVRSRAVAWRHTDMHETWDPEQWLWTLTSGNSVDADLWGSEVTWGSTSFLFEKRRASKTEKERGGVRKP